MSTLQIAFLILGAIATVIFVAGYVKGAKIALSTYDDDTVEVDDSGDIKHYWAPIAAAVGAAIAVIGLMGVNPIFIYAGPLLVIGTAAGIGSAFFFDRDL